MTVRVITVLFLLTSVLCCCGCATPRAVLPIVQSLPPPTIGATDGLVTK